MSTTLDDIELDNEVEEPAVADPVDMVTTLWIGPGGLDRYLKLVGDRRIPLIKYHDGSLTLVSPSRVHERGSDRIDAVIKGICAVLNVPYEPTASTLFRRKDRDHGIESDRTYYLAHEADVRGKDVIDLDVSPPPDLAVEVVVANPVAKALKILAELRVPEGWGYRPRRPSLVFLRLDDQGRYVSTPTSLAFPFLTPADVLPWIGSTEDEPTNVWEARLRAWVRDVLGPRHNRPANP